VAKTSSENPEARVGRAFAEYLKKYGEGHSILINEYGKRISVVLNNRDFHHIGDRQTASVLAQDFLRQSGNSGLFSEQVHWSGAKLYRGKLPRNDFKTLHVAPKVTFHQITHAKRVS